MYRDINAFIKKCLSCQRKPLIPYATLFQVSATPKWSRYIVDYLTTRTLPEHANKARRKAIELEAQEYTLLENQLDKRGKDNQL